jgi:hypothetical protein
MSRRVLLLLGALLLTGAVEPPPPPRPLDPVEAARQGRALVAEILSRRPAQNATNTGILKIRDAQGRRTEIPVRFEILVTETNWSNVYCANTATNAVKLTVTHMDSGSNEYRLFESNGNKSRLNPPGGRDTMIPFSGSDFWVADLGLEFFHWPGQRLLRKEIRRGQSCDVLESVNPHPAPGAYARVLSWIDVDTGEIIYAEAFDAQNKVLKEFLPKSVRKVRGEWQLQEMEMDNRQTGSRTRIEFDIAPD